jgi:hypothetical protein
VVLWVIKGDDIRLLNEDYQDKLKFVLHRLGRECKYTDQYFGTVPLQLI